LQWLKTSTYYVLIITSSWNVLCIRPKLKIALFAVSRPTLKKRCAPKNFICSRRPFIFFLVPHIFTDIRSITACSILVPAYYSSRVSTIKYRRVNVDCVHFRYNFAIAKRKLEEYEYFIISSTVIITYNTGSGSTLLKNNLHEYGLVWTWAGLLNDAEDFYPKISDVPMVCFDIENIG
jgi:hypothetical protein